MQGAPAGRGGGGVHLKAYRCVQGGRGGQKIGIFGRTYFMDAPKVYVRIEGGSEGVNQKGTGAYREEGVS